MTNPYESPQRQSSRLGGNQHWIFLGAVFAALAVGLGAFGAHGLDGVLSERHSGDADLLAKRLDNWKTAALYQMHHSIGLILVGLVSWARPGKCLKIAGWCFIVGIVLFSGLLFVLVLTEIRVLGAIVPIGGVAYIVGWIALAMGSCCLAPNPIVQIGDSTKI